MDVKLCSLVRKKPVMHKIGKNAGIDVNLGYIAAMVAEMAQHWMTLLEVLNH